MSLCLAWESFRNWVRAEDSKVNDSNRVKAAFKREICSHIPELVSRSVYNSSFLKKSEKKIVFYIINLNIIMMY